MSKPLISLVALLALLLVLAGLYATGPKYMVYCDRGHTLASSATYFYDPSGENEQICVSKYHGSRLDPGEWRGTRIRRLGAFERIWYSLVGSKNTRG